MSGTAGVLAPVAVAGLVTLALRFLPFLIFRRRTPEAVIYLGRVLPGAMMAVLVVYCLRGVTPLSPPYGIPEAAGIAVVLLLHKWKHSMLLSVLGGTVLYMLLVQLVF